MKSKRWPKIHVYRGARDQWYWRLRSPNGRIVAVAGEGFKTKAGAERSMRTVIADFSVAQAIYDAPPNDELVDMVQGLVQPTRPPTAR